MCYVQSLRQGKFLYFYKSDTPISINVGDNIYVWDGDEVLYYYTVNDLSGDASVYNFYFSDFLDYNNNPEETTTETTETTENTENNNNVVIDNTGVIKELQEIKSYLLMFFASFFLYFGYKIVKETTNKKGDKL